MKRRLTSQIIGGLVLIGIGTIFLLRQMGYTDFSIGYVFSNYWPVILIVMGVQRLLATGDYGSRGSSFITGVFFTAMGIFFLGRNLEWFDLSTSEFFKMFIPVLLIGGGIYVIFKPRHTGPPAPPVPPSYFPPDKGPVNVEPPKPLESTLDEQFAEKFGKPAGEQDVLGSQAAAGGKTDWDRYLSKDQEDNPGLHSHAESRWREKRERHERRYQERMERHARKHDAHWHEEFHDNNKCKDTTNRSAFIGDIHMGREHFQLKNTNLSQFIGDTVLDLTNAQIPYGETKINISAFVGDIKVYIPDDMDLGISVNSSSFIGDMQVLDQSRGGFMSNAQCKTPYYKEAGKKIRINVSAFIGDIKVKTVG
ncbi:cell wall-active antibiotics response protein LiaF [Paenibacillus sp. BR2-3]|uniref:cell wall-active antibiotics response protein LiaF n=1 Tax=Paenibacillus sp. BR2-3 TaxID=3048494 RepID=UPI0039779291